MGKVMQAGNRMDPAREAALHGGVGVAVPALTVNRVCGSGAQAILSAAQEILLGNVQVAIAGGMENMDRAPYLLNGGRWGYRMGDAQIQDSMLLDGLNDAFSDEHSGWHTEYLVTKIGLTPEEPARWRLCIQDWNVQGGSCPIWTVSRSTKPSQRFRSPCRANSVFPWTSSMSKAALSPMVIRLAPPGRCWRRACFIP